MHFLAVLIDASEKKNLIAFEPMITRDNIGQHFLIGVTDVRRRIRIIDRRGDVEGLGHWRDKVVERRAARNSCSLRAPLSDFRNRGGKSLVNGCCSATRMEDQIKKITGDGDGGKVEPSRVVPVEGGVFDCA